jgi:hypothetical protein
LITIAERIRENVSHIARGCRSRSYHDPSNYVHNIEADLKEISDQLEEARWYVEQFSDPSSLFQFSSGVSGSIVEGARKLLQKMDPA